MKKLLLFIGFLLTIVYSYGQASDSGFLHTATAGNISNNWTTIDHSFLNGNTGAKLLATHHLINGGPYSDKNIGVYYRPTNEWVVYNEDVTTMAVDTQYNIYVGGTENNIITYTATGGNYYEIVDHPFLNGNPNAKIVITTNYGTGYNVGNFGVYYSAGDQWGIFNEDGATPIPAGTNFNIVLEPALVGHNTDISYIHNATAGNISGNYTIIDHPILNNNPNANFIVTHNLSGNALNTWVDKTFGVWYSSSASKWTIFNQDTDPFVPDSAYNIAIPMPAPENDHASGSIALTLEPFGTGCSAPVTITNVGATDSSPINGVPTCGNFSGGDIWYYFTAPPSGVVKLFRTVTGNWGALSYGVYLTPSSTSAIVCDYIVGGQASGDAITGLTPGTTYGLRIWEWDNNDFGTEEICLRSWLPGAGIAEAVVDGFSMYPNPVENNLNLSADNTIDAVSIYNMLGQEVLQSVPSSTQVEIDMSSLATGSYIVKVHAGDQVGSYNLIKQ